MEIVNTNFEKLEVGNSYIVEINTNSDPRLVDLNLSKIKILNKLDNSVLVSIENGFNTEEKWFRMTKSFKLYDHLPEN